MTSAERELLIMCAKIVHDITAHNFFRPSFKGAAERLRAIIDTSLSESEPDTALQRGFYWVSVDGEDTAVAELTKSPYGSAADEWLVAGYDTGVHSSRVRVLSERLVPPTTGTPR